MTKPMNVEAIEQATGKTWEQWLKFFDSIGAKDLDHHDIALKAYDHLVKSVVFDDAAANQAGKQNSSGWWSQNVTVAYEQHIGRRAPGQRSDGKYEVSVTKTIDGDLDEAFNWWLARVKGMAEFNGVALNGQPKTSKTDKWRHWRVGLSDGTRVIMSSTDKPGGKSLLAVTNQKMASSKDAETWRTYWKQFLA